MTTETRTLFNYPITSPVLPDASVLLEDIRKVFVSGRVTMGKNVEALEQEICVRLKVKHSLAVSSATSGLILLLRALSLPSNSEVITPSFTFAATAHALLWNGLKPVFCDSEPHSFTMDASAAEMLVTKRTSAIYPVCIFGVPGDMDSYEQLARAHDLVLIFDSAQGLGSSYKGKALGSFGMAEVFSLSPTKVVTALEGGLITTNNDALADQLRHMRDYGKAPDGEDMRWLGLSARMNEVNAIVARWSLARLDGWIANRAAALERYKQNLQAVPGIDFQHIPPHCTSTLNYVVIQIDPDTCPITRNELHARLKNQSVQTKRYFYPAVHNQSLYRNTDSDSSVRLEVAEKISSQGLALPLYSNMNASDVDEICNRVIKCIRQPVIRQSN
ncbi:DegT/DnrJ/EryC1/StrS family aminotransferase [bacterium]|nr:DegT/DnrJ/EryC1/StrS family aminotransferase [bacterium]